MAVRNLNPPLPFMKRCVTLKPGGKLIWLRRPCCHFATRRAWKTWNTRFAGEPVGAGSHDKYGYLRFILTWKKRHLNIAVHRVVFLLTTGRWPDTELDHRNRKRDDNRFENLRPANRSGQTQNAGQWSNNTSGFKGVSWDKTRGRWQVGIKLNGKRIFLGRFAASRKKQAYAAYLAAKKQYHSFQPEQH